MLLIYRFLDIDITIPQETAICAKFANKFADLLSLHISQHF